MTKIIKNKKFKAADSQVASWWGNILDFKGFDLITPNEREARFSTRDQISGIRLLASKIYDLSNCKNLILKLGKRGILTCMNNNHESTESYFTLDSFAKNIIDPVGSGDALLAYSSLSLIVTNSIAISSIIGLLAASCACETDGNVAVTHRDILTKLKEIEKNV